MVDEPPGRRSVARTPDWLSLPRKVRFSAGPKRSRTSDFTFEILVQAGPPMLHHDGLSVTTPHGDERASAAGNAGPSSRCSPVRVVGSVLLGPTVLRLVRARSVRCRRAGEVA